MQTRLDQVSSTPDSVLSRLKDGNNRFLRGQTEQNSLYLQAKACSAAQFPLAGVLSCADSRVVPEYIFDQGIGDIFTARTAGNVVDEDILGSMEFACKLAGVKLIVVLGHTDCGAIKGACDSVELGNLSSLLARIGPAVEQTPETGDRSSRNASFVNRVARVHVRLTTQRIRTESETLRRMEAEGAIRILGAIYELHSCKVHFLDD